MSGAVGLYLHVPFCRSKCAYCDFYSLPRRQEQMDRYLDNLTRRLEQWGPRLGGHPVDTIYLGGGTPSLLGPRRLKALLNAVRRTCCVDPAAEITLEANPDSADAALLDGALEAGVNRLSLGVQSADDGILARLGRPHTFQQAQQAFAHARQAGFQNISADLIYGLPGETDRGFREAVERVLALDPEHLSVYGLKLEPGTPLFRQVQLGETALPDDEAQADRYLWVCRRLEQAGLAQYEISNFARPGLESRHNWRYWRLQPYLGLGPGAHSDFQGRRFAWARDLDAFLRGEDLYSEDAAISPAERRREAVMLGLRTREGIPAGWADPALCRALEQAGLAVQDQNCLRLTPRGFLVSNAVILRVLEGETMASS